MPNGSMVTTSIAGLIVFPSGLQLHDVFYIPTFTCSLISVSKLLKNTPYNLNFSADLGIIQDKTTLRTIGLADLHNGLYYLRTTGLCNTLASVNCSHVNSYSSFDL
jgi:hypothetical protein